VSNCRLAAEHRRCLAAGEVRPRIRTLPNVLSRDELARIHDWLPAVALADGRITNPDSNVKRNLQAPQGDAANERIAHVARDGLAGHPTCAAC
jgi:PKHD-type hydroxylase